MNNYETTVLKNQEGNPTTNAWQIDESSMPPSFKPAGHVKSSETLHLSVLPPSIKGFSRERTLNRQIERKYREIKKGIASIAVLACISVPVGMTIANRQSNLVEEYGRDYHSVSYYLEHPDGDNTYPYASIETYAVQDQPNSDNKEGKVECYSYADADGNINVYVHSYDNKVNARNVIEQNSYAQSCTTNSIDTPVGANSSLR